MVKILNTSQIKELDAYTIEHEPIASIDLMERACSTFCDWFISKFKISRKVGIVCGPGNNGGDGLGIARLLSQDGYSVKVWIVLGSKVSEDFETNRNLIPENVEVVEIQQAIEVKQINQIDILIDALFGSGLTRPAEGIYAEVIEQINRTDAIRVAVDIPSGLMANSVSMGAIVKAHFTLTFQLPKLAFMMADNYSYVGEWIKLDIGLSWDFQKSVQANHFYLSRADVRKKIKKRLKFSHKGDYGKGLLIAGAKGKMGACVLAARAAIRSGIGLLTVRVPGCGYSIIQNSVPEAMALVDSDEEIFSVAPDVSGFDVTGIGPGIGQSEKTAKAFLKVIEQSPHPLVIDADGLNLLSAHREGLSILPAGSILTPHTKEFERLVGESKNDFDKLAKAREFSERTKCVVILKGAHSAIILPNGKIYFNSTGNPGMATGGSGDVLTGMLIGLLAQKYTSEDAAIIGTYVHGRAGDLAANQKGEIGLIASDFIEWLPEAFKL